MCVYIHIVRWHVWFDIDVLELFAQCHSRAADVDLLYVYIRSITQYTAHYVQPTNQLNLGYHWWRTVWGQPLSNMFFSTRKWFFQAHQDWKDGNWGNLPLIVGKSCISHRKLVMPSRVRLKSTVRNYPYGKIHRV